ncbi:hypothetical protein SUGI_0132800 [Cryptomeria japonica]|uniref:U-box domain-containing protein 33 n=1 Tax=Cryptomeria japonica TaxID=3369 RepID=UPI002408E1DC|nr:U-box domain-containing protein 33 [Cryptomeria japonica]GLJ10675.1 hypothetical protein SUGI_0132800 [Cryptomeria japonica]
MFKRMEIKMKQHLQKITVQHLHEIEIALTEIASLAKKNNRLMRERDDAIKKLQNYLELRSRIETSTLSSDNLLFRRYSLNDIKSATGNFSEHLKVGEGDYGVVYRGEVEETMVAVKVRREDGFSVDQQTFHQQIDMLRDIRHPHLVRILGVCLDRECIMYEYMANGSLADHLYCKIDTPPLLWHIRIRIINEVCAALHYLHSFKPNAILHCDLKPENILLDEFYVSKISDVGMARLLPRDLLIKSNISYLDEHYLRNGEFTHKSDVYSLGITILQLLTGQHALGLVSKVAQSLESGQFHDLLDPSAGEWPFDQAIQLAYLALDCTESNQRDRPDLHPTLTKTLNQLQATASTNFQTTHQGQVPSFLICPISQELMDDPHVAADGFTYELEAIKEWFDSNHNTSPMTNLKLDHTDLIPNHSLRSAIREWKEGTSYPQDITSQSTKNFFSEGFRK